LWLVTGVKKFGSKAIPCGVCLNVKCEVADKMEPMSRACLIRSSLDNHALYSHYGSKVYVEVLKSMCPSSTLPY
jgi:hypothetical protein